MPIELGQNFRKAIEAADARLRLVTEKSAQAQTRPDGWSGKQVLGHLIDSALNNHQRFVRAALAGEYAGPSYEQQGWVDLHGYADLPWASVLAHWREQNELLCRVVERIPEEKLGVTCRVAEYAPVTLRFVIEDYLNHLKHHVDQIAEPGPAEIFLTASAKKMLSMTERIKVCLANLSEDQVWHRSSENCNSVGNLVLHLAGNIRQWIGHGVGGAADIRQRSAEFAARGGRSGAEIFALFEKTVADAVAVIDAVPVERLTEKIKPQDHEVAVLQAIYHVTSHMQEHTGQIIFAAKQMTDKDFQFYKATEKTPAII